MKIVFRLVCGLFFCCPQISDGARVPGLYEAETVVVDQSPEKRRAAIRTCLRMVLVKLTGERQAPRKTALLPVLNQAEKFVQQYRYREVRIEPADENPISQNSMGENPISENAANENPIGENAAAETELRLSVKFDEQTLNQSLRELGVAIWPKERSSVLIWLVVEKDNRRTFAGLEEAPELLEVLYKRAQQRGISILFPLLDLEDQARIQPSDVWGNFKEPIMEASARYHADIILTASILSPADGIWRGKWTAYRQGAPYKEWLTETDLMEIALDEGVDGMTDILAAEYARANIYTELRDVEIIVADIYSVEQYSRVMGYLHSLSAISRIHVKQVETGKVTLALTAHGGERAVMQTLGLGRVLEPVENTGDHYYRLLP